MNYAVYCAKLVSFTVIENLFFSKRIQKMSLNRERCKLSLVNLLFIQMSFVKSKIYSL